MTFIHTYMCCMMSLEDIGVIPTSMYDHSNLWNDHGLSYIFVSFCDTLHHNLIHSISSGID